MKLKALITDIEMFTNTELLSKQLDIEPKKDKNQQEYWIIRTKNPALIGFQLTSDYFAFSSDLKVQTKELLTDYPHKLVNRIIQLTLKEEKKVIEIDFK